MDNKLNAKVIGELPMSTKPWSIAEYKGVFIFANEEHPSMLLTRNGILKPLENMFTP